MCFSFDGLELKLNWSAPCSVCILEVRNCSENQMAVCEYENVKGCSVVFEAAQCLFHSDGDVLGVVKGYLSDCKTSSH